MVRSVRGSAIALVLVACGGARPEPAKPVDDEEHETERGAIPDDVVGPPNVAWQDLDHKQRAAFMKRVVLPTMKPLFVAFDPKKFRNFDCATCHGHDRDFRMPNPGLFVLPAHLETLDKPAWLKFMASEVKPEMAKLLGLPETAFACSRCHTVTGG
jgi:hypothetical protein